MGQLRVNLYEDWMETKPIKEHLKMKKKRIKKYNYWLILLAILIYTLFIARYNLFDYWQTRRENRRLIEELRIVQIHNERLKEEINDLRSNPEAWERIAREKLGMQRKDETVIKFENEED